MTRSVYRASWARAVRRAFCFGPMVTRSSSDASGVWEPDAAVTPLITKETGLSDAEGLARCPTVNKQQTQASNPGCPAAQHTPWSGTSHPVPALWPGDGSSPCRWGHRWADQRAIGPSTPTPPRRPPLTPRSSFPGMGQTLTLKNISTDMSGFYICTSSNEVGTESCNITLTVRPRKSR